MSGAIGALEWVTGGEVIPVFEYKVVGSALTQIAFHRLLVGWCYPAASQPEEAQGNQEMVDAALYAEIRFVVREIEATGVSHFTLDDVAELLPRNASTTEILMALTELWEAEGIVYSEVVGGAVWAFGRGSPGAMRRRPFAKRR